MLLFSVAIAVDEVLATVIEPLVLYIRGGGGEIETFLPSLFRGGVRGGVLLLPLRLVPSEVSRL